MFLAISNFVAAITPAEGIEAIWGAVGKAMEKIKVGFNIVVPELMVMMGDYWIVLIPFGMFIIITFLTWLIRMVKGFG